MPLNHDCYMHPDNLINLLEYIENDPDVMIATVQRVLRSDRDMVGAASCFLLRLPTLITSLA